MRADDRALRFVEDDAANCKIWRAALRSSRYRRERRSRTREQEDDEQPNGHTHVDVLRNACGPSTSVGRLTPKGTHADGLLRETQSQFVPSRIYPTNLVGQVKEREMALSTSVYRAQNRRAWLRGPVGGARHSVEYLPSSPRPA